MRGVLLPLVLLFAGMGFAWSNASGAEGATHYFLVGPKVTAVTVSYVLPLSDPGEINEARRQLMLPIEERKAISARIASGPDWINRDYFEAGQRLWHWHVTELIAFGSGGSYNTDGRPSDVEQGPDGWIARTGGIIHFRAYAIRQELELEEIFSTIPKVTQEGLHLRWISLGTNYLYTVEVSSGPDFTSWAPASGTVWPIAGTEWTSPATSSSPVFYRVRAEKPSE